MTYLTQHADTFVDLYGSFCHFEFKGVSPFEYDLQIVVTAGDEMVCEFVEYNRSTKESRSIVSELFLRQQFTYVIHRAALAAKGTPAYRLLWRVFMLVEPMDPLVFEDPPSYKWLAIPESAPEALRQRLSPRVLALTLRPSDSPRWARRGALYACEFLQAQGVRVPYLSTKDLALWLSRNWNSRIVGRDITEIEAFVKRDGMGPGIILAMSDDPDIKSAILVSMGSGWLTSAGVVSGDWYRDAHWAKHFDHFMLAIPR
jgi:hypothetical protein